ncbi:MAG: acyl-CoA thioesterase domain-containing protein, partial [Myxococcota bacterium]
MTRLPPAYFVRDGDEFRPTALTIGPWDPQLQHGGPASALLARALEHEAGDEVFIARVTVELLRPLPLSSMEISVRPLRIGRQVMWWDVDLVVASKHVARATGVGIRREALDVPALRPNPPSMLPDECEVFEFPFFATEVAYHRSVEIRRIAGEWSKGPMKAWMRTRQPLIEGEVMSSLQRTLSIADA